MFAEAMAGVALVKASVEFIKSNIDTAKDIGEIAGAVDNLFKGQEDIEKKRSKKAGVGVGDQLGIKTVAQEVIDSKVAMEAMQEMKQMINMRFGPNTWQEIIDLRAKRIQEEKERIAAAKKEKIRKAKETAAAWKNAAMVAGAIIVAIGLFVFLFTVVI